MSDMNARKIVSADGEEIQVELSQDNTPSVYIDCNDEVSADELVDALNFGCFGYGVQG